MMRGVAVFDLDGTLLRGDTVCEVLAKPPGRIDQMKRLETFTAEKDIEIGRGEMAGWYKGHTIETLQDHLRNAHWAPGADEAIRLLQEESLLEQTPSLILTL